MFERSNSHKFLIKDKLQIIKIYTSYEDKSIALKKIKSIPGCEHLIEQKILHWMSKSKTGKPISTEFEGEVIEECKQFRQDLKGKSYPYTVVQLCAKKIFDKDYWDESSKSFIKKWHFDRRTYKLHFTNKWVYGMLKRNTTETEADIQELSTSSINHSVVRCNDKTLLIPNKNELIDNFDKVFNESLLFIDETTSTIDTTTIDNTSTITSFQMHQQHLSKTGKAISIEFEDEVIIDCKKLLNFNYYDKNNINYIKKTYSYSCVRECAKRVFDNDYWDESSKTNIKKWHHDKRTCKLLFTNKWVCGMLKRYTERKEASSLVRPSITQVSKNTTGSSYTANTTASIKSATPVLQSTSLITTPRQIYPEIKIKLEPVQDQVQETIVSQPPRPLLSTSTTTLAPPPSISNTSSSSSSSSSLINYPLKKVKIEPTLLEDIKNLMLMRCLNPHHYDSEDNYFLLS